MQIEFAGLRLRQRDQLSHVLRRNVVCHDEHLRHLGHQRDGLQILQRIVGNPFHRRADGERAGARKRNGVAIGRCLGEHLGAEHAALAAAIVDDHRLLGDFRHALAEHARDDVAGAAGRERHDQPDLARRKIFCAGRRRRSSRDKPARNAPKILMVIGLNR